MSYISLEKLQTDLSNIPKGQSTEYKYSFRENTAEYEKTSETFSENGKQKIQTYCLYKGVTLSFIECIADEMPCFHECPDEGLEINYCFGGRAGWKMRDNSTMYLGCGDFAVHTKKHCQGSVMTLPNGFYSGLTIYINIDEFEKNPPFYVSEANISAEYLRRKFCFDGGFTTIPGSNETQTLFESFFYVPNELRPGYFKLKFEELIFYLYMLNLSPQSSVGYPPEQIELIKQIHEKLTENLEKRITIEELSTQFPINPSSMKILFKAVYGNSIAAHIKEHRMEKAAVLLRDSGGTVAEIAKAVGYDSQSKFSSEFKKTFNVLPTEYRKLHK